MKPKVIMVSGGLGDIGKAITVLFGQQGRRVAICDLMSEEEAGQHLEQLHSLGCKEVEYSCVDITSEEQVTRWFEEVESKWGLPQVIVSNAGIVIPGMLTGNDLSAKDVQKQLDVNFWGSFYMTTLAAKKLKASLLPGSIIFIGSWAAERPNARISSYCISKAAVRMLCKTMALELSPFNIIVNEIAPGIVEGGLSKKNQQKDPSLLQKHLDAIPMKKLTTVEEVASHVLWLSHFENITVTGSTLMVDGGISLTSKLGS